MLKQTIKTCLDFKKLESTHFPQICLITTLIKTNLKSPSAKPDLCFDNQIDEA